MEDVKNVASVAPTTGASDNPVITLTDSDRKRRDGGTLTMATNIGLPVGDNGYLNLTAEYKDRSPTNRSGADLRRNYAAAGDPRETPIDRFWHRLGDGQSKGMTFFYNSGTAVGGWGTTRFG